MLIGIRLTFCEDGTGKLEEWGFDCQHLDPDYVTEPRFQWKAVGDRKIEITYRGETREVGYDFKATKNEYEMEELRMFEPDRASDENGEVGFWISPFSLKYVGESGCNS